MYVNVYKNKLTLCALFMETVFKRYNKLQLLYDLNDEHIY